MNKLNQLTKTLNSIKLLANKFIGKIFPIMEEISENDSDIIDEMMERGKGLDEKTAMELIRKTILEKVEDSKNVANEIDAFMNAVVDGEKGIERDSEYYPFLWQVWCGDIYDVDGISGLLELRKDLKYQLSNANEEKLIETALGELEVEK